MNDGKPFIFPDREKRITTELHRAPGHPALFIVDVFFDDMLLLAIWCDRITVFASWPPTYCLYVGSVEVAGFMSRLMTVQPALAGVLIPESTIAALGDSIEVGEGRRAQYTKKKSRKS